MGCCTAKVLKYVFFVFNVIFAVLGLFIVIIGVIVKSNAQENITPEIKDNLQSGAKLLIVIGLAMLFISVVGCVGVFKRSACTLMISGAILFFVGIVLATMSTVAFSFDKKEHRQTLDNALKTIFENDHKDMMNRLQQKLECCGFTGPEYWKGSIPSSCCGDGQGRCSKSSQDLFAGGCENKLWDSLVTGFNAAGAAMITIALVAVVGVYLAVSVRKIICEQTRRGVGV